MNTIRCVQCGKSFVPSKPDSKFCSRACYYASWRKTMERVCPQCGKTFRVPSSYPAKTFCSRKCYWDSMRTPVTREQLDHWYNELGETSEQIAQRLGINGRSVRDLMEKMGVPRRDKVDAALNWRRRPSLQTKAREP